MEYNQNNNKSRASNYFLQEKKGERETYFYVIKNKFVNINKKLNKLICLIFIHGIFLFHK